IARSCEKRDRIDEIMAVLSGRDARRTAAPSASSLSRVRGEGQGRCLTSLGVGRRIGAGTGRSSGASSKRSYEIDCGLQYCSRAARSWPKVFGVMTPEEEPVYSTLRALDIGFDRHEHP